MQINSNRQCIIHSKKGSVCGQGPEPYFHVRRPEVIFGIIFLSNIILYAHLLFATGVWLIILFGFLKYGLEWNWCLWIVLYAFILWRVVYNRDHISGVCFAMRAMSTFSDTQLYADFIIAFLKLLSFSFSVIYHLIGKYFGYIDTVSV